jgi:hypothetical protein
LRCQSAPQYCGVNLPDEGSPGAPRSRAPRHGLLVVAVILIAMALLALYSNVQHARRDQIETVTIAPPPVPSPSLSPAATP